MRITRLELLGVIYDVLRQAQTKKDFPPIIIGQLSEKETWIADQILKKSENVSLNSEKILSGKSLSD